MNKNKVPASMMGVWIGIGVAVGIATHQLALWIGVGVALGAATAAIAHRRAKGRELTR